MKLDSSLAAVITGGASGLGAATARRLAAQGVRVALFDVNEEQGEALARELGGVFCKVDVCSDDEVDAALAKARAAHGQERILVNCAGVGGAVKTASRDKQTGAAKHFPLDAFNRVVQINLVGTFRCIAKSAAGMLDLLGQPLWSPPRPRHSGPRLSRGCRAASRTASRRGGSDSRVGSRPTAI